MTPPAAPFGEVDALYEKATKGPWNVHHVDGCYEIVGERFRVAILYATENAHENAKLIAAIHTAYPALKAAHAAAAAAATAARNDALEEAAGVCEAMKIRNHFASNNFPQAESGFNEGVHEAAKAIRALKAAR